jgi:hypothetical protein
VIMNVLALDFLAVNGWLKTGDWMGPLPVTGRRAACIGKS